MTAFTPSEVHLDVPLTNLTTAYLQDASNFVADRVFPNVPVDKQSNKYYTWDRDFYNRVGDVKPLAPGVETETISMSLSNDNYFINVFGIAMDFSEQMLANEDTMLNVRSMGAQTLANRCRLKKELDWIETYFKTGVWTTEYTGVANADNDTAAEVTQWDDYTNSTPIVDVTTAKRAMFLASGGASSMNDTVMVVTQDVRDTLLNHPDILARLNGGATVTNPALVTDMKLAEIFDVSEFIVIRSIQNTAKEGLTESLSFTATKKAAIYSRPRTAGLMVPAAGYNFTWTGLENSSGYGVSVMSYSGEHLAVKHIAEKIEVVMGYDQKVVSADMGIFFNTILS